MNLDEENQIIETASAILKTRLSQAVDPLTKEDVQKYLQLRYHSIQDQEIFGCVFFDLRNKFITDVTLFHGTLAHCAIYPREIVKAALVHGAMAIVLYHTHPSGDCTPSRCDVEVTESLIKLFKQLDIVVYDHIIVGRGDAVSLKKAGYLNGNR